MGTADRLKVLSVTPVGLHVYCVVTESRQYGRVEQTVLMLPPGVIMNTRAKAQEERKGKK